MNGRLYFVYMRKTSVCRALGFLKSGAKSFEGEEDQGLRLQREGAKFLLRWRTQQTDLRPLPPHTTLLGLGSKSFRLALGNLIGFDKGLIS